MSDKSEPRAYGEENGRRVLYITYKADCRFVAVGGKDVLFTTRTINDVLPCVRPGDILQFLPGKYWPPVLYDEDSGNPPVCRPVKLYELSGKPDVPITIRGLGEATQLDGGLGGVPHDSMLPEMKHFAFFKLKDCAWIEFENFEVESCWPSFIYLEDSSYITVRGMTAKDSRYLVYARGQGCHHILLEDNKWRQDTTGSMWRDILWLDSKRKRYFYYNGGLFGSLGIPGSVVVRRNSICDAFNGLRMKADKKPKYAQNHNVEIYDNHMLRIRDNPVEPERAATNWWIHHNRIHNAHAWFSLDEVVGGFWYFFANTGWITDKPGNPLDPSRGGKVYKYDTGGDMPDKPVFAFNNSFRLCNSLIKGGATTHLTHRNNAVLFRTLLDDPVPQDDASGCPLPEAVRHPFPDGCTGADRFVGDDFLKKAWKTGVSFDWDLCNLDWPKQITRYEQEQHGVVDPGAAFVDPDKGDLRLKQGWQGCEITLEPGTDWPGDSRWSSGPGTLIGAYQGSGDLVDGPPFAFLAPEGEEDYVEMPRLVRLAHSGVDLELVFSTPLVGPGPVALRVTVRRDGVTRKLWLDAKVCGRSMKAVIPAQYGNWRVTRVRVPDTLKGANGQYVTLWSSVFKRFGFYAAGRKPAPRPYEPVCFCNCGEED